MESWRDLSLHVSPEKLKKNIYKVRGFEDGYNGNHRIDGRND